MDNGVVRLLGRVLGWLRGLAVLAVVIAFVGGALWLLGGPSGSEQDGGPPPDGVSDYRQDEDYQRDQDERLRWQLEDHRGRRQAELEEAYEQGYDDGHDEQFPGEEPVDEP
ncbi:MULTISPECIES: hypothetical protein [Actinosynnema]|uniref:hypothetical protein n=1 Tax=Actinosynnema TaxID=40566 RepID=UPI0020A5C948|nr:hypothetical protein [Actinosynnema pretiosum]MCP2099935.1 hypothetical protein [Actinosynnema pretiosum]